MNIKNMMSPAIKRVNRFSTQDLSVELIELSEKDLQHIVGGCCCCCCCSGNNPFKDLPPLPPLKLKYGGGSLTSASAESLPTAYVSDDQTLLIP